MRSGALPQIAWCISLALLVSASLGPEEVPELPLDEQAPDPEAPPAPGPEEARREVEGIVNRLPGGQSQPPPGQGDGLGDIGRDVADAVTHNWLMTGAVGVGIAGLAILFLFLANRYVDPGKALENPHRSLLYGFVKGNPGVHLKQLSNEFGMKTSTVLWHIRKLECADLVRSRKSNGYRIFYPVSGGAEARQLSTAITALSNPNARRILESITEAAGRTQRQLAESLAINPGTVRWHLKKLRAAGLVGEAISERARLYHATEVGTRALDHMAESQVPVSAPAAAAPAYA